VADLQRRATEKNVKFGARSFGFASFSVSETRNSFGFPDFFLSGDRNRLFLGSFQF